MDLSNPIKLLVEQGKNSMISLQNLKQRSHKKNKERSDLYNNFRANEHSFRVYTYMDPKVGQSDVVQSFLITIESFGDYFTGVNTDFSTTVDKEKVNMAHKEAIKAFNNMVTQFGYDSEKI